MKDASGIRVIGRSPLEVLTDLGGYYERPKDDQGQLLGPIVGYAGRDELDRQYVGEVYADFAAAEEHPSIYEMWGMQMWDRIRRLDLGITTFVGMPMGGIMVANAIGRNSTGRVVYAEKKVIALPTEQSREKTKLLFARHSVGKGDRVAICEDVTNNFSTTDDAISLISQDGAEVVAILTYLNRSSHDVYDGKPVVALVHRELPQYRQDDAYVAADIAAGNVIWKPKADRAKLQEIMRQHASK